MLTKSKRSRTWDVLTAGDVSAICRVCPRKVAQWFDSDDVPLHGYRIPGGVDRRFPIANVLDFMRAYDLPIQWLRDWMHSRGCDQETIDQLTGTAD